MAVDLDAIAQALARASVGDFDGRVDVADDADLDEPLVAVAHMVNILLEDMRYRTQESERVLRLAEARANAALALRHVADGVLLVDDEGVVRLWNPAAAALTGLSARAAVGHPVGEVMPGWSVVESAGFDRGPVTVPVEIAGRERWLSVSRADFPGGCVYAFRDRTADRALQAMQGELVATVSHELRTPLAAVYGAVQTLDRRRHQLDERMRDTLYRTIVAQAERLRTLIDDLLVVSRLERDALAVERSEVDLDRLVADSVAAALARTPDAAVEVVPNGTSHPVAADPDRVRQVLDNLLDNALRHGGTRVQVSFREGQRGRLAVAVRDWGPGVAPADRERIFHKFSKLDPNVSGGAGLGLYIVRELVRRMDGRITVEHADPGARFVVELPRA